MSQMFLMKSKSLSTYRLFSGWVDYAKRKKEAPQDTKAVYRSAQPRGSKHYGGKTEYVATVEKNSATLSAMLKRDSDERPLVVFSHDLTRYVELTEYLKMRAERKAKKLAAKVFEEPMPTVLHPSDTKPGKVNIFAIACDGGILGTLTHLMVAGTLEEAKAKFEKAHPDETVKSIELQPHPFEKSAKAFPKGKVN